MAKKFITYEVAKSYIKDKDKVINTFIQASLNKTQQIFTYANLPETIPQAELENILQTKGQCIIAEEQGELYALPGTFAGEYDVYNNPRFYTVANPALKISKTYELGKDCVLVKNDYHCTGLLPIIYKYGALMLDCELSLNTAAILARIPLFVSAPDDKTKASADLFISRILDGDFSIIGENGFFDGVKVQTAGNSSSAYIIQLIELMQWYKANFLNEIGLQAQFNMKRENLNEQECAMNIDALLPFVDNMFSERIRAFTEVNSMFNQDIIVDFNSAWKTTQENADKEADLVETDKVITLEDKEDLSANGQSIEILEKTQDGTQEVTQEETKEETQDIETEETKEEEGEKENAHN